MKYQPQLDSNLIMKIPCIWVQSGGITNATIQTISLFLPDGPFGQLFVRNHSWSHMLSIFWLSQ